MSLEALRSYKPAYKAAEQSGTSKLVKKTKATLLETLILHGLEEKYNYIVGGEKSEPPNIPDMVHMEISGEAGAAASYGGRDAPPACKRVLWEEQVQMRDDEEWASKDAPKRKLPLSPLRGTAST